MIDTSTIDLRRSTHRSPKVDTAIFESRHIDRRSSKVDTSIIDLRKSTHRSSKVDTSIFETRHIDHRRSTHRSSKIEGVNIVPTIRHRIFSTTAFRSIYFNSIIRSYTRPSLLVSRSHTLSKTGGGLVCLASTTRARGMSGMFGLRNLT